MSPSEKKYLNDVSSLGCIVCKKTHLNYVPAEVHHLLKNGRRIDHFHVIPLCTEHHRGGRNDMYIVSRHPWHKEFERRYGKEDELLEQVREELQNRSCINARNVRIIQ